MEGGFVLSWASSFYNLYWRRVLVFCGVLLRRAILRTAILWSLESAGSSEWDLKTVLRTVMHLCALLSCTGLHIVLKERKRTPHDAAWCLPREIRPFDEGRPSLSPPLSRPQSSSLSSPLSFAAEFTVMSASWVDCRLRAFTGHA